jgi:torso-like protein
MISIILMMTVVIGMASGASIGSIAQNVHSDVAFLNANLASGLPNQPKSSGDLDLGRNSVPIGGAVDLYYRYGFFSLSIRVVPRDDPGAWLIREPTNRILEDNSLSVVTRHGPNSFAQMPIEISLCDDVEELKEAYFRAFAAEGIAQPHKLYTGSWRLPTMARYLGISVDVLNDDSSFVLLKLVKNTGTQEVTGNLRLSSGAAKAASNVRPGDEDSVLDFVQNYGSHFLQSVTVGDAIYQVLAIPKEFMAGLKGNFGGRQSAQLDLSDWSRIHDGFLAPWKVRETGNVRVASGDIKLQRFVDQEFRINGQFGTYPSLVGGLIENPGHVRTLEELGRNSKAVVGVNFASLKSFVGNGNIQAREYYDEIIDTTSALWESNL